MSKESKKNKQASSSDIIRPLKALSKRFHLILFFVFIVGCVAAAVLLINNTLQEDALDPNYTSSINAGTIDQQTLTRLHALHTSSQGAPAQVLPQGRINPIGE